MASRNPRPGCCPAPDHRQGQLLRTARHQGLARPAQSCFERHLRPKTVGACQNGHRPSPWRPAG
eukprot:10346615-Lingulodinium_polyedra.AAC.1